MMQVTGVEFTVHGDEISPRYFVLAHEHGGFRLKEMNGQQDGVIGWQDYTGEEVISGVAKYACVDEDDVDRLIGMVS